MAKCVLTCVYVAAILLIVRAHGSEEINEVEVKSVAVRGSMYDGPYILSGKNLSFLPFFTSGRENISICIEVAEDPLNYSTPLQDKGFSFSETIFLDKLSKETVPWDCSREKNLTYFEENAAILSENFEVNLFIWDKYQNKIYHYKTITGKVPARNASLRNTDLTVRLAQPVNIEDVRVQLKWSLYFTDIRFYEYDHFCSFKPNSYAWRWNNQLWVPTYDFECSTAITIYDGKLNLRFRPRTPILDFPLDTIKLKLRNGHTERIKEENILILMKEKNISFHDFVMKGRKFPTAKNAIDVRAKLPGYSRVEGIKMTFLNTLDMKLGEERLSIHEVLKPKEGEALRVIYSLPSPLTKRSELNMSVSPSHWLIEKISVIPASGAFSENKSPPNASATQGVNVEGIGGIGTERTTEDSTKEAVTPQPFRAGKFIGIACGVTILLIAVIAVVIKKCRRKNRSPESSDTQRADIRKADTGDADTKEACAMKSTEPEQSHEMVELETKGIDKSTNKEDDLENLSGANTKAQSEFTLDASIGRKTIPLGHENIYEEENLIYGEF